MDGKGVYFDNAATTRVDDRVIAKMMPFFKECYGNASSLHGYGAEAKEILEECRKVMLDSVHADKARVVFTSGGTESNNLAIKGVALANERRGRHIIASAIEHDCILNTCRWLAARGFSVACLPVNREGLIDPNQLESTIREDTVLVSIMHVNNEIGTIQPITEIGEICRRKGVYFHCDACQGYGKTPLDLRMAHIDLLTLNSHKIYGPKGAGALIVREGVAIEPIQHGGGHEYGLRSSTENIPGIVGFCEAARICMEEMDAEEKRLTRLRDMLIDGIIKIPGAYLNGHRTRRICNNVNVSFHGYEGEGIRLLLTLDEMGYAVSAGSACSANDAGNHASHVLTAIGRNPIEARGALRISLGRFNTEEEVLGFLDALPNAIGRVKPIYSFS